MGKFFVIFFCSSSSTTSNRNSHTEVVNIEDIKYSNHIMGIIAAAAQYLAVLSGDLLYLFPVTP